MSTAWLRGVAADLKVAVLFATRIPLPHKSGIAGADIARASWALPLGGLVVGLLSAATYWIASSFRLPALVCAALAVAASLAVTGGLHEDGLADTCDGLGGSTRERRLEIMRDSRLGTYGTCALVLSLLLRVGALASLGDPAQVAWALTAAHPGARALMPMFLRLVPPARSDGLAADAGRPPVMSAAIATLLGLVMMLVSLGGIRFIVALSLLAAGFGAIRWLTLRQIGGQTGDVAGALEQVGEILVLLVAAAGRP